jgi:hypothetical protein
MSSIHNSTLGTLFRQTRSTAVALIAAAALLMSLGSVSPSNAAAGDAAGDTSSATAARSSIRTTAAAVVPVEMEAPDFASEVYTDAWDYSNPEDQNTDASDGRNIVVRDGRLHFDATGGTQFSPVTSVPGALAYGRDGAALTIDTTRYKRLSFRMDQPSSGVGVIYWFTCRDFLATCAGGVTFSAIPGDHVYDIALEGPSTIGAHLPWSGRMVGLQVRPTISLPLDQQVHVSVDWVRLWAPTAGRPHGMNPPGSYGSYVIQPQPMPVIDSPNPSEGLDVATAQRGRPWDFTDPANSADTRLDNARLVGFDGRGITATNSPPNQGDPSLALGIRPFDASVFHHLSFDLTYDGPFALYDGPGGGKMTRVIWTVEGSGGFQESDDIVTYGGVNARPISIDLNAPATSLVDPNSRPPQLGWTGRSISSLRFDPNEDAGPNTWHLRSVHLRADPAAAGATTVRFHDNAWTPGTTADLLVGTGAPGTLYTVIAQSVAVRSGQNAVVFSLDDMPEGSYRVQLILRRPSGDGAQTFSRTAITMTRDGRNDPQGALDLLRRAPGGAVVAGWARDPSTTDPIAVHLYADGAAKAAVTANRDRPDVAQAIPGAQLRSGYEQSLPLTTGEHSVCAYGIDVGPGDNRLLDCEKITIDGRASGSLDSVSAVPGGIRAAGWAIDPDTAQPIPVHVYVGSTARATVADQNRPDVADAWVGYGAGHGYSVDVSIPPGNHSVCAYGIGSAGDDNALIGCRSIRVVSTLPIGTVDVASRAGGDVRLQGWALDPDGAGSIAVHVYVNGQGAAIATADVSRADVGAAFPGYGAAHGFDLITRAAPGSTICAYAIDGGSTGNTGLGCRTV